MVYDELSDYDRLEDGSWLTKGNNYVTITRGAIDAKCEKIRIRCSYLVNKTLDLCQSKRSSTVFESETGLDNYRNATSLCQMWFQIIAVKFIDFKFKEYFFAYEKVSHSTITMINMRMD
jgi:hypothetical protein